MPGSKISSSYDLTSKLLVENHPGAVLRLIFPHGRVRFLRHEPTELPAQHRTMDRLLRVQHNGRMQLLHVELQTEWHPNIPERVADYRTRLRFGRRNAKTQRCIKQLVSSVVILLKAPGRRARITDRFVEWDRHDRMEVRFRLIKAWQLHFSEHQLRREPGLVPFAVLSHDTGPEDVGRLEAVIAGAGLEHEVDLDLRVALSVMAAARGFQEAVVRTILKDKMVAEHPVIKEIRREAEKAAMAKGLAKGVAKGLAKGVAKGRAEGRADAQVRFVRVMLRRLGLELEADQAQRLAAAPPEVVDALVADLFSVDATTAAAVIRQRLGNGGA